MSASSSRFSGAIDSLAALVGAHCAVTRTGEEYDGRGTLTLPGLDGRLLRPPELGQPMWLMIGGSNWVRTTAVVSVLSDESNHVVVVRTTDARYRFVFDEAAP